MNRRVLMWSGLGTAAFLAAGGIGWLLALPSPAKGTSAPSIPPAEQDAILAALKPVRDREPVIAVIGINDATETTDYLMPAGILRRADVGQVLMLATNSGPVKLFPALTVLPDATLREFDAVHPGGADYVIVPAMKRDDDP